MRRRSGEFKMLINQSIQDFEWKLLIIQTVAQEFYLNDFEDKYDIFDSMKDFIKNHLKDEELYKLICQEKKYYTKLNMNVLIDRKSLIGELVIYTLTNFQLLPLDNFFRHLIDKPHEIKSLYLPFIVNTRYDLQYEIFFNNNENFSRYKCVSCGEYFFVGDCGRLSNHRSKIRGVNLGGATCKCGKQIGYKAWENSQLIDENKNRLNFCPEEESESGYIFQDPEVYDSILKLRGLNNITKQIGQILLHLVILGTHMFRDESTQNKIQKTYAPGYSNQQYYKRDKYTQNALLKIIEHNCNRLKEILNINDDRLKLLLEFIIQDITIKCHKEENFKKRLSVQAIQTIDRRREFEIFFQDHCLPKYQDNFVGFFNRNSEGTFETQRFQLNKEHINETFNFKKKSDVINRKANMYHLLRVQGNINIERFQQYLSINQTDQGKVLERIIVLIEELEIIGYLRHLLEWMNSFNQKFNGKITLKDSDMKIEDIIKRDKEKDHSEKFKIFSFYWNKLADMVQIQEGCKQINIEQISLESKCQMICLTNQNKDSKGKQFYYIIKYVAEKQNKFLEDICSLNSLGFLVEQLKRKVKFTEVQSYQIVGESISKMDLIKEIKQNSINSLQFGQGRNVEYNIEKLSENLINKIIRNKVFISTSEEDAPFSFQFDDLINPFNQFVAINSQNKQERLKQEIEVIKELKCFEDRYNLLKDLQVTLNFISQTNDPWNTSLKSYMEKFKILSHQIVDEIIQLKHVLHFYEEVEQTLIEGLIKSVKHSFKKELEDNEKQAIKEIIKKNKDKLINLRDILGRLIVRQLCCQTYFKNEELFKYLFSDFNEYLFGIENSINKDEYIKCFGILESITVKKAAKTYQYLHRLVLDEEDEINKQAELQDLRNKEQQRAYNQENYNENDQEYPDLIGDTIGQNTNQQEKDKKSTKKKAKQKVQQPKLNVLLK